MTDPQALGPWLALLPFMGAVAAFLVSRLAGGLALIAGGSVLLLAAILALGGPGADPVSQAGGWAAPLGIRLRADAVAVVMINLCALVMAVAGVYARAYYHGRGGPPSGFWPLWLFLWGALNAVFLSGDIFNLYVCLELMSLAAVSLVALGGDARALDGALRYLLVSLVGSLAYLLGVAVLYHAAGTLDLELLTRALGPGRPAAVAFALMATGLVVKSALFPLHFWLPPAHGSAPTPVSAVLSALVVKASLLILYRLWVGPFAELAPSAGQVISALGALAVLWGSWQALLQKRLKMLVAYSTVAQLGYLFFAFGVGAGAAAALAWQGVFVLICAHALAKAAMFLGAGNILHFGGHDRIAELDRLAARRPLTLAAFGVAGVTLMGLPPSGGFAAKWLLLQAAWRDGQWWWILVLLLGGMLAAAYVFKVIGSAFTPAKPAETVGEVTPAMEWAALGLALASLGLGLVADPLLGLLGELGPADAGGGAP